MHMGRTQVEQMEAVDVMVGQDGAGGVVVAMAVLEWLFSRPRMCCMSRIGMETVSAY
jgi:hypothetical protein